MFLTKPKFKRNGIDYVSEHIAAHEIADRWTGEIKIYDGLVYLFEGARTIINRPLIITSGYRSVAYNQHLHEIGYKTAAHSPHCEGAAIDVIIPHDKTVDDLINAFDTSADLLKLPRPRYGHIQYKDRFLHIDLVFMLYKPYTEVDNPHPRQWKSGKEW